LNPIYWNNSNLKFEVPPFSIDVELEDKLDIICPLKTRDVGISRNQDNWYYKIYLVDQYSYKTCSASGGRRLITCESPMYEKKYTFYFQEISPSPWALEFETDKIYYIISTSDGSKEGLNQQQGGSCVRYNMKIQIRVNSKTEGDYEEISTHPKADKNSQKSNKVTTQLNPTYLENSKNRAEKELKKQHINRKINQNVIIEDISVANTPSNDELVATNEEDKIQILIGAAVGGGVVISILLCILIGCRLYAKRRRRKSNKYKSSVVSGHQRGVQSQVTLLPIHGVQSLRDNQRQLIRLPSSQNFLRSPPPYHESCLDNVDSVATLENNNSYS